MTPERLELERRLSQEHFGIVVSQALKFPRSNVCDMDDYIQEGVIALIKAMRTYDPNRGTKWSTYAMTCVYRAISHQCQKFKHPLNVPPEVNSKHLKIVKLSQDGYSKQEICETLDISNKRYNTIMDLFNKVYLITREIIDEQEDPMVVLRDVVDGLVDNLELNLLRMRLQGHTFQEIGDKYGKSNEWARRITNKLIKRIREHYNDEEKNPVV